MKTILIMFIGSVLGACSSMDVDDDTVAKRNTDQWTFSPNSKEYRKAWFLFNYPKVTLSKEKYDYVLECVQQDNEALNKDLDRQLAQVEAEKAIDDLKLQIAKRRLENELEVVNGNIPNASAVEPIDCQLFKGVPGSGCL